MPDLHTFHSEHYDLRAITSCENWSAGSRPFCKCNVSGASISHARHWSQPFPEEIYKRTIIFIMRLNHVNVVAAC